MIRVLFKRTRLKCGLIDMILIPEKYFITFIFRNNMLNFKLGFGRLLKTTVYVIHHLLRLPNGIELATHLLLLQVMLANISHVVQEVGLERLACHHQLLL